MPNLDKIFNKFYPQSQTGSKGKFLLNMAWTVEILVAVIGICIAIIVVINAQGTQNVEDLAGRSLKLNDITFGGIFFIVAIVELTKIPLATAVYYSVRIYWKVIFLIGLFLTKRECQINDNCNLIFAAHNTMALYIFYLCIFLDHL